MTFVALESLSIFIGKAEDRASQFSFKIQNTTILKKKITMLLHILEPTKIIRNVVFSSQTCFPIRNKNILLTHTEIQARRKIVLDRVDQMKSQVCVLITYGRII